MTVEPEIVPVVRDWLAATAGVDIPGGLSCEEARRRARRLLLHIETGDSALACTELDEDSKDVVWALVEELAQRPPGKSAFLTCDRAYQLVSKLSWPDDNFGELAEILHGIAGLGWRSAPGGIQKVLRARADIWTHGDTPTEEVRKSLETLPSRIDDLRKQGGPEEFAHLCKQLFVLSNLQPRTVAAAASLLRTVLEEKKRHFGKLDDWYFLTGTIALFAGTAARQLGRWDSAVRSYRRSASAFRQTADLSALERVETEFLALDHIRGDRAALIRRAPSVIGRLTLPREKAKAQLAYAAALVDSDRFGEALKILEALASSSGTFENPHFRAYRLVLQGNALSGLGRDTEAVACLDKAAAMLREFESPVVLANLFATAGEHVAKLGQLDEAIELFRRAREVHLGAGATERVAYVTIMAAELLLVQGRNLEAEQELLGILPTIEELHLEREAVVAVAFLRESLAKRSANIKAIQTLRDHLR